MCPWDGQYELLSAVWRRLDHPSLDAETLGRAVLLLERFVGSGLLSEDDARILLGTPMLGTGRAAPPACWYQR